MGSALNDFVSCLGCQDRHVGCQAVCDKYREAKTKHDERKKAMERKNYMDGIADRYERDTMRKLKAAKRLRGK